jgi:predicted Zn-dependent peptidase
LREILAKARAAVAQARHGEARITNAAADPETAIEQVFAARMSGGEDTPVDARLSPALIVVSGDLDGERVFEALDEAFGDLPAPEPRPSSRAAPDGSDIEVSLKRPVAQAQLGYMVSAPGPRSEASWAYRILLYILSHDYEGRLGKEAISNRGLAYYIDGRYRSDGANGWITLAVGVDPAKLRELQALLRAELGRLQQEAPTDAEIEEAKRHLVGRALSGAQSNGEISAGLAQRWLWHGELFTAKQLERRLQEIDRGAVLDAVAPFVEGVTVIVAE